MEISAEFYAALLEALGITGEAEIGWRVLDADGNVVDSGPIIVMESTSNAGMLDGLEYRPDNL